MFELHDIVYCMYPLCTATTKQQLRSVVAYDSTATTGPENKRGGSLGSATFIAIIVVCVLLGVAMVVVIIIVSM